MALWGDLGEDGDGVAIEVGDEGAESVGEFFRQHGNDLVDEVDRVAALAGFAVKGGAGGDVMGDIGDMNADDGVAARSRMKGDGIVEIFGGVRVNGDDQVAGEVLTIGSDRDGGVGVGEARYLSEGFWWELGGDLVFANDGEDIDAGVAGESQAFGDDAFGVDVPIVPAGEPGDDFVAGLSLRAIGDGPWFGDVEVVNEAGVIGNNNEELADPREGSDKVAVAAFEDADDGAGAAVRIGAGAAVSEVESDQDEILVQGGASVLGRDEDIGTAVLGDEKGEAFLVELDHSRDEPGDGGQHPVVLFDAGD